MYTKLINTSRPHNSEDIRQELCRMFCEYQSLKKHAFRRIISQELSDRSFSKELYETPTTVEEPFQANKRKQAMNRHPTVQSEEQDENDSTMNKSLRSMYRPNPPENDVDKQKVKRQRTAGKKAQPLNTMEKARGEKSNSTQDSPFEPEPRPEERLTDLGGVDKVLEEIQQLVIYPLTHPEIFVHLGVQSPTGVLFHGPPGSGKTKLAHAIAGSVGVPFFKVAATEIVSGMSGESEAKIRQLFQAALRAAPSLLFFDEIDAITPRRDNAGREMERRIVAQLLTCMDDLKNTSVVVIGATNRPDSLEPALRRAGRFDREIAMGIPDEASRCAILRKMTEKMRLGEDLDLPLLAQMTPGYVGADLCALTTEAALCAVVHAFAELKVDNLSCDVADVEPFSTEEMAGLAVTMSDFRASLSKVQPSAKREGFATIPNVKWDDIGALSEIRTEIENAVCEPIRKASLFKKLGLTVPVGVLLYGPPGCGKTLLAKATANASAANFISVKGPELLNKYVGESERAVRLVFQRASNSAPCVVFFDELDALVPRRSTEGSTSSERVVNQMLTEMDGMNDRMQVFVIAATNRPDIIDPAMLRPGRLDRLLFVPLPSRAGRFEILRAHSGHLPLATDVDLHAIALDTEGFSGADLAALMREAALLAIRAADNAAETGLSTGDGCNAAVGESDLQVTMKLVTQARERTSPSVSKDEAQEYEILAKTLGHCNRRPEKCDLP